MDKYMTINNTPLPSAHRAPCARGLPLTRSLWYFWCPQMEMGWNIIIQCYETRKARSRPRLSNQARRAWSLRWGMASHQISWQHRCLLDLWWLMWLVQGLEPFARRPMEPPSRCFNWSWVDLWRSTWRRLVAWQWQSYQLNQPLWQKLTNHVKRRKLMNVYLGRAHELARVGQTWWTHVRTPTSLKVSMPMSRLNLTMDRHE